MADYRLDKTQQRGRVRNSPIIATGRRFAQFARFLFESLWVPVLGGDRSRTLPRDHQAGTDHQQDDASRDRQFLIMLGGDSNVRVADAYSVMVVMRERYDKSENPEDQYNYSNQRQTLHTIPP